MHLFIHVHPPMLGLFNFKNWLGTRKIYLQPYMGGNYFTRNIYVSSLYTHIQISESLNTGFYNVSYDQ